MLRSLVRVTIVLVTIVVAAACGKKGAPLAPIVRIPAGVTALRAERLGADVYLSLTIPATNVDRSIPVDIARVDIYGYTGHTAPPRGRFVEAGTLVASIPVNPLLPVPPASAPGAAPAPAAAPAGEPTTAPPVAAAGMVVSVVDTLTADELVEGPPLAALPVRRRTPLPVTTSAAPVVPAGPLHRYYVAIPFSMRGRPGPEPAPADLPLFDAPMPPTTFAAAIGEASTTLTWEPSGGLLGFLFEGALPAERPPDEDVFALPAPATAPGAAPVVAAPTGRTKYNIYSTGSVSGSRSDTDLAPAVPWQRPRPLPLNMAPLATPAFVVPTGEFGIAHCFQIRGVRGDGPGALEGPASEPLCFTPIDTFPPAAPAGLVAVAAEGSVSLIWEPAGEPDLAGYLVLRGPAGSDTLQPLTPMPIAEARFIDMTARAGTMYVYAVVAVDKAMNVSAESNRVEETGR